MKNFWYCIFLLFLGLGACENGPATPGSETVVSDSADSATLPTDSPYFMFSFRESSPTCETADSLRCAEVEVNLHQLKGSGDAAVTRINDFLRNIAYELVTDYLESESKPATLGEAAQQFVTEYEENMKDMGEYVTPWTLEVDSEVLHETPELFTVGINYYTYTGGAHPNHAVGLYTFDRSSGEPLNLRDRITNEAALMTTVKEAFRREAGLDNNESLQEAGYFFGEEFSLPVNMALTDEGVLFNYNPYEVAPYALGYTTFTIPYNELEGQMNLE